MPSKIDLKLTPAVLERTYHRDPAQPMPCGSNLVDYLQGSLNFHTPVSKLAHASLYKPQQRQINPDRTPTVSAVDLQSPDLGRGE